VNQLQVIDGTRDSIAILVTASGRKRKKEEEEVEGKDHQNEELYVMNH